MSAETERLAPEAFPALGRLCCPVCGAAFARRENSLVCAAGHCFDIARRGFVNLAPGRKPDALYTRALFESRRRVLESGLFDPVTSLLRELAGRFAPDFSLLADAGCGEGFYTRALLPLFDRAVAFDLAREGVALAASGPDTQAKTRAAYLVADLTRIPLQTGAASVLLDVFTPARYAEFARALRPGGLLLKALPRPNYLCQIRALAGKAAYRNDDVTRRLDEMCGTDFEPLQTRSLTYTLPLSPALRNDAARMTPLTQTLDTLDATGLSELTVDMEIVAMRRRG